MVKVGFTQISPSMISFFNIYDIPTTLKIHWAMIRTCLYAAGANLNQIWVPNAIFWTLLASGSHAIKWVAFAKWVACVRIYTGQNAQVGRISQVGLTTSRLFQHFSKTRFWPPNTRFRLLCCGFWQMNLISISYTWGKYLSKSDLIQISLITHITMFLHFYIWPFNTISLFWLFWVLNWWFCCLLQGCDSLV